MGRGSALGVVMRDLLERLEVGISKLFVPNCGRCGMWAVKGGKMDIPSSMNAQPRHPTTSLANARVTIIIIMLNTLSHFSSSLMKPCYRGL